MPSFYDTEKKDLYDSRKFSFSHSEIYGLDGNDEMLGSKASQQMYGGSGNDTLFGGYRASKTGNGKLESDPLKDFVLLASGNDVLYGDSGSDAIYGGDGSDVIYGGTGDDSGVFRGNNTNYYVGGLWGGTGNDRIYGGTGKDDVFGQTGKDTLDGGTGDDRLSGGADADILRGGLGADRLSGGTGADRFHYESAAEGGDTITGFSVSTESLTFKKLAFGNLAEGAIAASAFKANASGVATDASDRFVFETDRDILYYDGDGNGAGGRVLIADFITNVPLTAADIIIV
jgi:Ca2+-binding RTX toxin-like protein